MISSTFYRSSYIPRTFTGCCYVEQDRKRQWMVDGVLHRINGPAVETDDDWEYWFFDGLLHRLDGPAVSDPRLNFQFYIFGKKIEQLKYWSHPLVIAEKIKRIENI